MRQWQRVAIGAGAAMFLGMGLGRFGYSAMIPALIQAGDLNVATAGYIGGANLVGFLIGAAASTVAVKIMRIDRLLCAVVVLALAAQLASILHLGAAWLGGWRAVIGISTGCIMVLGLSITAQAAPPEHRARAMSIIFIGVGGGILFGGTILPVVLEVGTTAAWIAMGIASAVATSVAIRCWRDVHRIESSQWYEAGVRTNHSRASWYAVIAASFLFSLGLVPHTIYWFDYLARELGLGYQIAGWHWAGVGIFAILGPVAVARLASATSTVFALFATYLTLAVGFAAPWFSQLTLALVVSTIIFGAQPAVSTLLGARARDLGAADQMPAMMRAIILSNGIGSAVAGIAVPRILERTGSYELLFLMAGGAMALGALVCLPSLCHRKP